MAQRFATQHGDILSVMFIGGIPWEEALRGRSYSDHVKQKLATRPAPGQKLFLSISPLDMTRSDLAPYWGETDNMPLPAGWRGKALDSPEVKRAYQRFVLDAVARLKPDYLAIAVEANILLTNSPAKWSAFTALYRDTRLAVRRQHPNLPVFFTTDILHLKGLAARSDKDDQLRKVKELMRHSDLFAMSVYPHMSHAVPRPLPQNFLDVALQFGKPIAMAETGMTSQDVHLRSLGVTVYGTPQDQENYVKLLLQEANEHRYRFVVKFATTDFEKLCRRLPPPTDDLARVWSRTGLQDEDGRPKPALGVWRSWFNRRLAQQPIGPAPAE